MRRFALRSLIAMCTVLIALSCLQESVGDRYDDSDSSLEVKLASLDVGANVSPTDPSVAEVQSLLDSMERKYANSRMQISDISVFVWNRLREMGQPLPLISVMRSLNRIPDDAPKVDIAERALDGGVAREIIEAWSGTDD